MLLAYVYGRENNDALRIILHYFYWQLAGLVLGCSQD